MCVPYDSHPPAPPRPIAGAAADAERLTLTAADGARLAAYLARAAEPRGPAVVVLPDVRGLFGFYEELALRFAQQGYDAVAIDYFGRTAGTDPRAEDFDFRAHVAQTTPEEVRLDVAAAVACLRELGDPARPVFAVGFCFGGTHAWLQAAGGHGLAGVVGFYGMPVGFRLGREPVPPIERVADMRCPVLALQAGEDQAIPNADNARFDEALSAAAVEHEVVTYAGAPHSFFDRRYEEHAAEAQDAWERVLAFIERYAA